MPRFVTAFLVAAGLLASCNSGDVNSTPTPISSPTATIKLQFYRLGATVKSAKGTVTVYAYDASVPASSTISPDPGDRFVAIDVEGCAGKNADENTGIEPLLFYLQLESEPIYPIDPGAREPSLHKTVLAPGRCVRGWVTFEVTEQAKPQYAFFRSLTRSAWVLPK